MAGLTKKPVLHADAHVIERARLTQSDFDHINRNLKDIINKRRALESRRACATASSAPPSNTGGKIKLVCDNGEIKEVIQCQHYESEHCIIDWVNFTCHEETFSILENAVTDDQVIASASLACHSIFGFGITAKRDRGANFYKTSFTLGDNFGLVCHGGQRHTILIMLNGEGCAAAVPGWERRLHDFLKTAQNGRLTRIDLAHDDIDGKLFTPESLETAYDEGQFNCGGRNPDIELRGNWKNPNGKGRTVNVGNRTNGKFFRGYEKGKQLGDPASPWMRLEVEFKSTDRIIPFETLLFPHEFFAAAYPLLSNFSNNQQRILTVQKTVEVSYERTKKWLKRQCGAALHLMNQVEGSPEVVLDLLMRDGKIPKGVKVPSISNTGDFLHERQPEPVDMNFYNSTYERLYK